MTEAASCKDEDVFIVGGANSAGQAAMYFSSYARRVVMLVRGGSLSAGMSQYLVEQIKQTPNIHVELNSQVTEAFGTERLEAISILCSTSGETQKVPAASLFIFIGAEPQTDWLHGAVERDEKGFIKTDEYQQTGEKGVYAIGDVVPTPLLAHLASKEGIVAVEHIAGKNRRPINLRLVPNCTYCDPEIGSIGLSEAKAREAGYDVKVGKFPFSASGKARIIGEEEGFVKVVSEKKYDEILGVHIIGPHATELIAEAGVAMQLESTAEELRRTMHAHPTVSEAVMEAAEGVHDMTIHI